MLYMMATFRFKDPSKIQEFNDLMEKTIIPIAERHGQRLLGSFRTAIGDVFKVIDLWAFDDWESFAKARESLAQEIEYQGTVAKLQSFYQFEALEVLRPLPISAMK